jgi:hypothetical protein
MRNGDRWHFGLMSKAVFWICLEWVAENPFGGRAITQDKKVLVGVLAFGSSFGDEL